MKVFYNVGPTEILAVVKESIAAKLGISLDQLDIRFCLLSNGQHEIEVRCKEEIKLNEDNLRS
jgi:hypothetical protein